MMPDFSMQISPLSTSIVIVNLSFFNFFPYYSSSVVVMIDIIEEVVVPGVGFNKQ